MAKKSKVKLSPAAVIKKLLETEKIVIGADRVEKLMRQGRISKVFVTLNCKESVRGDIESYARISKAEFVQLDIENDELGVACKKPFSISVIGVVKK